MITLLEANVRKCRDVAGHIDMMELHDIMYPGDPLGEDGQEYLTTLIANHPISSRQVANIAIETARFVDAVSIHIDLDETMRLSDAGNKDNIVVRFFRAMINIWR